MLIRVTGRRFDSVAANNTAQFSSGEGHCIEASATLLVFEMDVLPDEGNLMCRITNSNGTSEPIQVATIVPTRMVGHWPLNEGTGNVLGDESDSSNDLAGTAAWNASTPGAQAGSGGCLFASSTRSFSNSALVTAGLPVANRSRTVAFWYKLSAAGEKIDFVYGDEISASFFREAGETGVFFDVPGLEQTFSAESAPTLGSWHHYALTWDGWNTWTYHEDGEESGGGLGLPIETELVGIISLVLTATVGVFVKDLRVYDSALPADQIRELFTG